MALQYSSIGCGIVVGGGAGSRNSAGRVLGPPVTLFGWIGGQYSRGWGGMGRNRRKMCAYVISKKKHEKKPIKSDKSRKYSLLF